MKKNQRKKLKKNQNNFENITFWEHIDILKKYLFIVFFSIIFFSSFAYVFNDIILEVLTKPLNGAILIFLSPIDSITFLFKIDFLIGFILSIPLILYFIWRFVSPALDNKQKKALKLIMISSLILSIISMIHTYLYLIQLSLNFLLSIDTGMIEKSFTAQNYLNFIIFEIFLMIFIFQIPLIIIFLTYFNIYEVSTISSKRGYIYVALIILISVITPTTDMLSLVIILIPMYLLFEIGLILARLFSRKKI